jgi:hypothetical protein
MTTLKMTCKVRFGRSGPGGRKELQVRNDKPVSSARTPRVARLMALAIRLDRLIREGTLKDQADVARLGNVTRARVTQIMNLLSLAPDLQEALLFLPAASGGWPPLLLRDLQPISRVLDWRTQRELWRRLSKPTCKK